MTLNIHKEIQMTAFRIPFTYYYLVLKLTHIRKDGNTSPTIDVWEG